MRINKELTNKYFESYIPCNCGDCRYFIKHIETEKPELCKYLRTLGINPLKPFELMSVHFEKDKRIEYFDDLRTQEKINYLIQRITFLF